MKSRKKKKIKLPRSPVPPPSMIHKDKRKKTRAQEKQDFYREAFLE